MQTVRTLNLPNYGPKKNVKIPIKENGQIIRSGSFSSVMKILWDGTWVASGFVYCREYFHDDSSGARRMLFAHKPHKGKHISAFLNRIEEILGVTSKSFFGPTQRYNIMWIMPSKWWMDSEMKRSLFTCLLRCGCEYNAVTDNFDEALWSNRYTKQTKYAVCRFLAGYTRYMGSPGCDNRIGWYDEFRWGRAGILDGKPRTHTEICRLLRRPDLSD